MASSEPFDQTIGRSGISVESATVAALTEAMNSGSLTSAELVAFYSDRIERHNASLGAVISMSAAAATEATAIDQARANGAALGPLAGIPVLIKDNISAAGSPATAGSPALSSTAASDAFLVTRLRAAGAVILGKANLSEWANFRSSHSTSGWSSLGGQAVNPHGPGRNPSGSSSGSAVAVAAWLAPLAVGTETDGSIVSPSHACGIVGIKPTVGLVSRTGIVPISAEQDTAGPMAGCVADAAALLAAMTGSDASDAATADADSHISAYQAYLDPAALDGARIGVWREGGAQATPATAALFDDIVRLLQAHGAAVIDPVVLADADKISDPEFLALRHEFKDDLNGYLGGLDGDHPRSLAELITFNSAHGERVLPHFGREIFEQSEASSGRSGDEYETAREQARSLARSGLDNAQTEHKLDAVLALSGNPAWLTDYVLGDHYSVGTSTPAAVSGYPSITVPAGKVSGLPVGVSLMGSRWSEPRLIALAYALEHARAAS